MHTVEHNLFGNAASIVLDADDRVVAAFAGPDHAEFAIGEAARLNGDDEWPGMLVTLGENGAG